MSIFFVTSMLFAFLALLGAIDTFSTSFNLLPWFNGLRWLRIHLITLGVLTNIVFGLVPVLSASFAKQPKPRPRLDIWLALNAGILSLLVGIPLINPSIIVLGGGLVFAAVILLMGQLRGLKPEGGEKKAGGEITTRHFYLTGLAYLLLGIFVGTGLWLGWNQAVGMLIPIEVHIHANNWGFLSLVFAGLLFDLYPRFSGRPLRWPDSIKPIYWMMTIGALGLVIGPWFQIKSILVPGLLLHVAATIWMALNVILPVKESGQIKQPGYLHLALSYVWILAPIMVAPMILLKVPGFPGAGIEANAPQALIYGWALQFGFAILPYLFGRVFGDEDSAQLGGTMFSVIAVNAGSIFLWASIFMLDIQNILHGMAYLLWGASLLAVLLQTWRTTRSGIETSQIDNWA